MAAKTVVLIHGNFVTKRSWDPWVERYRARGYHAIALAYPGKEKPVEEQKRRYPDPTTAGVTITEVVNHLEKEIKALPEKPIVMGHSFGGLMTQLMLQRNLGVAGVAIDSVPPKGVLVPKWSFFKATWPFLNPAIPASKPYYMTFPQFQYAFVNTQPLEEQRAAYDRDLVPESRVLTRGGLSSAAKVDFTRPHPPLLMIAGEKDNLMPAALNKANAERYKKGSASVTEFKVFPGRSHYIIGQKGWEEVADYALDWAVKAQSPRA